jgi:hypothetical protein
MIFSEYPDFYLSGRRSVLAAASILKKSIKTEYWVDVQKRKEISLSFTYSGVEFFQSDKCIIVFSLQNINLITIG